METSEFVVELRWISIRCFFFQSPFEANETWIICKATCFKQKGNQTKKQ